MIDCIDYVIHTNINITSLHSRLLPKKSPPVAEILPIMMSIVRVVIGVVDKAACSKGESISGSWHGVEARGVDAGLEEAPTELSDTVLR